MATGLISIIVPVYNRPDEIADLLTSLADQDDHDFEIVIVEDGSSVDCRHIVEQFYDKLNVQYHYRENEGRSPARNYGIIRANGDFLVFVDSDTILPPSYISSLKKSLAEHHTDCFGGPDAAHESFSPLQKAINYSMTSFLTTGGIRGGKISMEKFVPRTFNMGFSRKVYDTVGGFREMFSEDIDMSTRIRNAGFTITLYHDVKVYHKRRVDLRKFMRQVYVFGMSRITLEILYPGSMKLVHTLPALFTIGATALLIAGFFCHWLWLPLIIYFGAIWITALFSMKSLRLSLLAVVTSIIQLTGYGCGFIKAYTRNILLRRGRDLNKEIEMRRGK
jgi:glycosyltransferase involved in cell wall biosynthesis